MTRICSQAAHQRLARILWICLLTCGLAGCQAGAQHKTLNTAVMDDIHQVMSESAASASVPAYPEGPPLDVLQALVPGLSLEAVDMEPEEERFDFAVREPLDLKEFFSLLFEGTNYSVIVHPDLTGSISAMDLKNVTVSEAMQQLSAIYGFSIQREGSIYRVEPGGLQTRIFKINYLNVQRDGTSNMSVTGGTGLGSGGGAGGLGGLGGLQGGVNGFNNANLLNNQSALLNNGLGGGTAGGAGGNSGGATVNTRSQSDYWQDLEEIITSIIGSGGSGSGEGGGLLDALGGGGSRPGNQRAVIISPQTGMVVVRAYPDELEKVAEFLEMSQAALQRQVVLEAKILEVELKEGFQSGIDLSVLGKVNTDNDLSAEFEFLEGSVSSISSPLSLTYGSTDFNGVIKLLETQGNVQVISSPRITTLNNQKAVFKVGDEEYFMTNANSTSFGAGDQQTTNQNTNLQPFFSGIALDVTPQISDNGDIILHIHPLLNQVQEDIKLVNGRELPLANSATRESDSIARARNGEVVVISGLMQTRAKGTEAGIPGARNLAVVGKALEQRTTEVVKTELVILLRAIVDEGGSMQQLIQEHDEGFDALRKRIDPYYR
jgi:MSHA biogenesis protein MshL